MSHQDNYPLAKFGIDEVYFHDGLPYDLLEKLHQRALLSLDAEDSVVLKYASHDILLIFRKTPSQSLIYRFLEYLDRLNERDDFIKSNTLLNQEELFAAIKSKNFVLVTPRFLSKECSNPEISKERNPYL